MKVMSIDNIREKNIRLTAGQKVAFSTKEGRVRIGTVRLKYIRCGKKNCTKCPHGLYVYLQYREGRKVRSKYVGLMR